MCQYKQFEVCFIKIGAILDFDPLYKFEMTYDLHKAIILYNLETKHRRYIKLYIFGILMTRQTIWHYFHRNRSMFQFLTHVDLSRSMAAILEMPQYVAYHKNFAFAFIKLSAKSHSFTILRPMDVLSCPSTRVQYQ